MCWGDGSGPVDKRKKGEVCTAASPGHNEVYPWVLCAAPDHHNCCHPQVFGLFLGAGSLLHCGRTQGY